MFRTKLLECVAVASGQQLCQLGQFAWIDHRRIDGGSEFVGDARGEHDVDAFPDGLPGDR
jgi:hypothetical protein